MKKILSIFLCAILILGGAFALAGCGENAKLVRVNEVTHSVFYAPLYAAIALGYFADEGLEIELTNGGGSDATMTAVLTGQADIGLCGPETAIYVYLEGKKDYPVIIGQLTKRDGSFLISRTKETNFSWDKLAGKEIIMGRRGGMPAMVLQYILNKHGYTDGVNIKMNYDVQFNLIGPAFVSGTGDYVPMFEPAASELVMAGNGYIVAPVGMEGGEIPYTCFMATQKFLKNNPQKAEKFLRAIIRATDYIMEHDSDHLAELLMPQFAGSNKATLSAALKNYKTYDTWMRTPVMTPESFKLLQDVLEHCGELAARVEYDKLIENKYANEAMKK